MLYFVLPPFFCSVYALILISVLRHEGTFAFCAKHRAGEHIKGAFCSSPLAHSLPFRIPELAAGSVLGSSVRPSPGTPEPFAQTLQILGKPFPGISERDVGAELPSGSCSADSGPSSPVVRLQSLLKIKLMIIRIPSLPPGCS